MLGNSTDVRKVTSTTLPGLYGQRSAAKNVFGPRGLPPSSDTTRGTRITFAEERRSSGIVALQIIETQAKNKWLLRLTVFDVTYPVGNWLMLPTSPEKYASIQV